MRLCAICEQAKLDESWPEDIGVCRECELARRPADTGEITPEQFVAGSGWRLASTMLDHPHQYTVRDLVTPDARRTTAIGHAEFEDFARLTAKCGRPARWGSATYTYLELDGWQYWTMGNPPEITTIINRRPVSPEARAEIGEQVRQARPGRVRPAASG